jgi:hypothetical protein
MTKAFTENLTGIALCGVANVGLMDKVRRRYAAVYALFYALSPPVPQGATQGCDLCGEVTHSARENLEERHDRRSSHL